MTSVEELVARLQNLEDERDIARLIASYGPLVDAGDADGVAALWAEDGGYDVEGWQIAARKSRLLNGSGEGHDLLTAGVAGRAAD